MDYILNYSNILGVAIKTLSTYGLISLIMFDYFSEYHGQLKTNVTEVGNYPVYEILITLIKVLIGTRVSTLQLQK